MAYNIMTFKAVCHVCEALVIYDPCDLRLNLSLECMPNTNKFKVGIAGLMLCCLGEKTGLTVRRKSLVPSLYFKHITTDRGYTLFS